MKTEELELKKAIREVFENALEEKHESKAIFENIMNEKEKFLKIFSPWHGDSGKRLIHTFVNKVQNSSDNNFSWLDILNEDLRWKNLENNKRKDEIADQNKHLNMRYQIPIHFHGNIDNAVIFHCMENPRGYLGDYQDNQIDSAFKQTKRENKPINLEEYYEKSKILLDNIEKNSKKTIKCMISEINRQYIETDVKTTSIIKSRHNLNSINIDSIANIIYSEKSNLLQELNDISNQKKEKFEKKMTDKELKDNGYYYLPSYYKELIQVRNKKGELILDFEKIKKYEEDVFSIAEKICNVELYPFSCAEPKLSENSMGEAILLHSDLSCLGAYIVLRRIYKYLQEKESNQEIPKPIIVFRKYDSAWKKLLKKLFSENNLEVLEKNFIYCQTAISGNGITSGNVISVPNYKKYLKLKEDKSKNNSDLEKDYKKWKKEAFDKITNGLPRITGEKENNKV